MNLKTYLDAQSITVGSFAATIGVSVQAVHRYISGERFPHRRVLQKIHAETGGQVQPNDFIIQSDPASAQDAA